MVDENGGRILEVKASTFRLIDFATTTNAPQPGVGGRWSLVVVAAGTGFHLNRTDRSVEVVAGTRFHLNLQRTEGAPLVSPELAKSVLVQGLAVKLRSSLTLFIAAGGGTIFIAALKRWFDGVSDQATLRRLPT